MLPLDFAKKIALQAGDFLKKNSSGRRLIKYKDDIGSNIVTDMDQASEAMIIKALKKEFPDHAIVAEESGLSGDSPHKWYIDPVDGTTNFAHNFPIWAVTLAYEYRGKIQAGATYAPMLGELYWAGRGKGAWCNGRRLHVTKTSALNHALLCTGFSYLLEYRKVNLKYFTEFLMKAQAIRRMGAASLDLCWTAAGAFDGFWEMKLGPWDMAAGIVILEEAGAKITDFKGGPVDIRRGDFLGANPALHRRMLDVLRNTKLD
ncbi:MAG TPA: inositol monophosphatase family protein [Planctomycetota bacterium]|nr:inositol monophosphatase family protein [Planctomycetota bacterium]